MEKNRFFYIGLYLALFASLILVFSGIFALSVSAADFDGQPLGVGSSYRITLGTASSNGATVTFYFDSLPGSPKESYVFFAGTSLYFTTYSTGSAVIDGSKHYRTVNVTSGDLQGQIDSKNIYFHSFDSLSDYATTSVPVYSSVSDAFNALKVLIEGEPEPEVPPSSFTYSLPPGNVAYIEMGSSSAIKLSMSFPELSNSFGTPFSKANSAYRLVDSLPTVGSSVSSGTVIPWAKSGRLNLIGQTTEAVFGPIGPIATTYVAVINPSYYDHVLVTGTYRQNPPIQIEALNVLSIQVYPLQSDFTFNNDTGEVTTTIAGDAYTGEVDSETGEIYWTDPSGGSNAPSLGGNNLPEAGNSIFDTLRNIASDFSEFLKGPISAVRVVVQAIGDFLGSFTQLYTWLPSPVYNLITSALMIALTIGVIKIFV